MAFLDVRIGILYRGFEKCQLCCSTVKTNYNNLQSPKERKAMHVSEERMYQNSVGSLATHSALKISEVNNPYNE